MSGSSNLSTWDELESKYAEEGRLAKLWRKSKEAPYVPIGAAGAIFGVAYGALHYKHRGKMSTSIYLIHMRVAAQSCVVAAVTLGVGWNLLKEYVFYPQKKED